MSEKYKFRDPEAKYFITLSVVYWIDLFTRKELKHVMLDSIRFCQENKGLIVHAWVLMPSHLHLIVSSKGNRLEDILRDMKKFTSKRLVNEIELTNESRKAWLLRGFAKAGKDIKRVNKYKVWQDGNHPILLETNQMIDQRLDYIHQNPVDAEIVDEPESYRYSSARAYTEGKGLLKIDLL